MCGAIIAQIVLNKRHNIALDTMKVAILVE
jgi:hypothetical protein